MAGRLSLQLVIVGVASACGLIVEIVAGRMIAPYLGMTLYTWTAIISVVLAGFSVGHWVGGLLAERPKQAALRGVAWSLILAGASTAASLVIIRIAVPLIIAQDLTAVPTVLAATLVLFFLPSFFVGIPSPVLTKIAIDETGPPRAGRTIGAFFAVSAVGSILGTLVAGFVLIAWLGTTATLLVVALIYVALALALFVSHDAGGPRKALLPALVLLASGALFTVIGSQMRAFTEPCIVGSSYYCIRVVDVSHEFNTPARALVLDHLGHGVNMKAEPQKLVSPYVELHDILARIHAGRRSPFRSFFIGGGAYTLPRAWAAARNDAEITVAEIDPEVTAIAQARLWLPPTPRIRTLNNDARTALRRSPKAHFDVIIGDAFHDIVVPPHLVTQEFFALIASRLRENGIYLMNVVDHRERPRLALAIYRTLRSAIDNVEIWATNESGKRATFVFAALGKATPYAALPSRNNPGVTFHRLAAADIERLAKRFAVPLLTDDHSPVSRLINVE